MNLIIAGGGTGGHIFAGIAIAQASKKLDPTTQIIFIGAERGLERSVVPRAGFPLELVRISGLKGLSWRKRFRTLFDLPFALLTSLKLLRKHKADAVIGV